MQVEAVGYCSPTGSMVRLSNHMSEAIVLDESKVLACLKQEHREIEVDAGKDAEAVTDDVQPLDGLGGFESTLIPNVIRGVAKAVGIVLAKGRRLRNPYVAKGGKEKLKLRDVAKRFCELYGQEASAS